MSQLKNGRNTRPLKRERNTNSFFCNKGLSAKIMAHRILDFGKKPALSNNILVKGAAAKDPIYYVTIATVIFSSVKI